MKLRKFVVMGIMIAISSIMLSGCGKDTATDQSEAFQKAVDEAVEKALEEQNQKTEEATQEVHRRKPKIPRMRSLLIMAIQRMGLIILF